MKSTHHHRCRKPAAWVLGSLAIFVILSGSRSSSAQSNVTTSGGTIGKLPKWTTSTALGDSVVAESNGNVGIGTTTPSQLLELFQNVNANVRLQVTNPSTGTLASAGIRLSSG